MIQFAKTFTFGAREVVASVDFATLPEASQRFIIEYGLKQYLNDGAAVPKDEGDSEETRNDLKADGVEDRLAKLRNGTMSQRGGGRTTDPVAKIKRDIALEMLAPFWKANDIKRTKGDELVAAIDRFWTKNGDKPAVKAELDERVAKMQKLAAIELDM